MDGRWTNGRPVLDGVFRNANSFLLVGNRINKVNLSFLKSFKHVF